MDEELNSLIENNTWNITTLPKGKKPIDCKWCFKISKTHMVISKVYSQKYGIEYEETFSPVVQ